jgi:hypothetical protein
VRFANKPLNGTAYRRPLVVAFGQSMREAHTLAENKNASGRLVMRDRSVAVKTRRLYGILVLSLLLALTGVSNAGEINEKKARELVENYKRALAYLNGVSEMTYDNFRQAIHLAGNPVPESEIRQQWEMAKMTLQGTESLRQTYREVWEKGIEVFGQIARELP